MSQAYWAARLKDGLVHTSLWSDIISGMAELGAYVAVGAAACALVAGAIAAAPAVLAAAASAGVVTVAASGAVALSGGAAAVVTIGTGIALSASGASDWISEKAEALGNFFSPPTIQARIGTGSEDTHTNSKKSARAAGVPYSAAEIAKAEADAKAAEEAAKAQEKSFLDTAGGWLSAAGSFLADTAKELWRPTVASAVAAHPRELDRIICQKHPAPPPQWPYLAEGARDVRINSQPAVRSNDRSECDAKVTEEPNGGADVSPDVRIGGPSVVVRDIRSGKAPVALIFSALMALRCPGRLSTKLACLGMQAFMTVGTAALTGAAMRAYSAAKNAVFKPVDAASGIKYLNGDEDLDFSMPYHLPFEWQRRYNSRDLRSSSLFGTGWSVSYEVSLESTPDAADPNAYTYIDESGRRIDMDPVSPGGGFRGPGEGLNVRRGEDGRWLIESDDGLSRVFEADPRHPGRQRLLLLGDRNGHAHWLHYDDTGRLVRIADDEGRHALSLNYDAVHLQRVTRIDWHRPGGGEECLARYRYDAAGDLAEVRGPDDALRREFAYDEGRRMIRHRRPEGEQCHYRWQQFAGPDGEEWRVVEHWTDGGEHYWLDYQVMDRRMRVRDSLGRASYREWNEQHQVTRYQDETGAQVHFEWNEERQLLAFVDAQSGRWQYNYDETGNLIEAKDPLGRAEHIQWHPLWALPLVETDAEGGAWRSFYDQRGNLVAEVDPEGGRTLYRNDRHGQPERITDAKGGRQAMRWNEDGQLLTYTDCSGSETRCDYDERGYLQGINNAANETTRYRYDAAGRLIGLAHPDGREECFERDGVGQLIAHTDPAGQITRYRYDARGLVHTRIDAAGRSIGFEHDAYGRLLALTNENGEIYRFAYDVKDRLTEQTDLNGRRQQLDYDRLDNAVAVRFSAGTPEQIEHRLERDVVGRLIQKTTPDGATRYAYNKTDHLLKVAYRKTGALEAEEPETLAFAYDKLGNLLTETSAEGALEHAYDPLGNLLSTLLPDGRAINRLYYGSGHLHQINVDGEVVSDFERDALHRELLRTQGKISTRQTFDRNGRLARRQIAHGRADLIPDMLIDKQYQYDQIDRIVGKKHGKQGRTDYRYDETGRILGLRSQQHWETQAYDAAANLLDAGQDQTRVRGNRLLHFQNRRYEYDAHGRTKTKQVPGQTQHYAYDAEHRLIEVTIERHGRSERYGYQYDPLGRRVGKYRIDDEGNPYQRTSFLWDGMRLIQETRPEGDDSLYLYGDEDNCEPLARIDGRAGGPSKTYYFHNDVNGAPEELSDADGQIVWETTYQLWGNAVREVQTEIRIAPQNLRYQGQYLDRETGLHYNFFRFYDPDIGRFITPDPIGLLGGLNLYQYGPDPLNWIDPWGLTNCQMSAKDKKAMGPAPKGMTNPHRHHIVREMAPKGWSKKDRGAIHHVQNLAKKFGMDVNRDPRNFVWAQNGGGAHTQKTAQSIRDRLSQAAKTGGKEGFFRELERLGKDATIGIFNR